MIESTFFDITHAVNEIDRLIENQAGLYLETGIISLCYRAFGGKDVDALQPIIRAALLLHKAICFFDNVLDDEAAVSITYKTEISKEKASIARSTDANIGTALYAQLSKLLLDLTVLTNFIPEVIRQIQVAFYDTIFQTAIGQQSSLELQTATLVQVWESAEAKSSPYHKLCCWCGTRLATEAPTSLQRMSDFGNEIGILIQIEDDVQDLWPNTEQKSDIRMGSMTLPIAYTLNVLPTKQAENLRKLLKQAKNSTEVEKQVREIVIESGALLYLQAEAQRHVYTATELLTQTAPDSAARTELLQVLNRFSAFQVA